MDSGKALAVGTKFTVDRLEYNKMSQNSSEDEDTGVKPSYYHIKGTDKWINENYVKATKKIPEHNIFKEQYTYINFIKDTDVYDAQGNVLDPNGNGQRIIKQLGNIKVNKLLYIWLPKENKAELFYHLAGKSFYATKGEWSTITVKDGYVKAEDVKYSMGIKLTPSNTPEEAKAAYEASQANTTK
ncbi:hypothetical protein [Lactobacillus sp. PSON]|uniref:hypothetical protein n=1 Tax=Lactobacillus sp. PSON TaxID=3455454 RepID=UPI0040425E2F